ncbi:MAG: ATPase, partial [Acidobacteriaceae bacterium]
MKTLKTGDEIILCISTRDQGHGLLRELAQLGCRVVLLTLNELRDAGWPHDALDDFQTMPGGLTEQQLANTVTYLARTRRFSRILALGAADMSIAAMLREHMRIPGMGRTTTQLFCDRLAMRARADQLGIRVPAYCAILNY